MRDPSSAEAGRPRRRLSNYLLDTSLQLRYVLVITAISAAVAAGFGYLILLQEQRASDAIMESFAASGLAGDEGLKEAIESELDTGMAWTIRLGVGLGLAVVLSLFILLMTHKVAGPLYKVSGYFDAMSRGVLGRVTPLRRGDMLTDFYDTFQGAHEAVRERHRRDAEALGKFLRACEEAGADERSGEVSDVLSRLRKHCERRERDLA